MQWEGKLPTDSAIKLLLAVYCKINYASLAAIAKKKHFLRFQAFVISLLCHLHF
jgi:hypothetical protein